MEWQTLEITENEVDKMPCDCCGKTTTRVGGEVWKGKEWLGFFFVQWTEGHRSPGPQFRIFTGDWADGSTPEQKWLVVLEYSFEHRSFMIMDNHSDQVWADLTYLNRNDILGTEYVEHIFAMVDAIFMKDSRLEWIRTQ